ncbi:MAG: GNAT family N-acetyltransferase, partial [Caldilineaceae bacterium]|nr:GNAT family N-acetyltransferase [Caldilineaceae bacterium]
IEPYRNHGLGTELLQRTLQWALRQSFRKISLLVNADNQRAIHLYHKHGFTTEQEVQPPVHAKGIWLSLSYLPNLSSMKHLRLPFEQSQTFEPH